MGLLEPQHILLLIVMILFSIWGFQIGKTRKIGGVGGLLLGFFLIILGIIIIYCIPKETTYNYQSTSPADELKKYKELLDNGVITEAEYNIQKSKILNSN